MKTSNLVRDKNILNAPTPVQSKIDDGKEAEKKRVGKLECAQESLLRVCLLHFKFSMANWSLHLWA